MFLIVFRNIKRNILRFRPLLIILFFVFFLVFWANSILDYIDNSFESSYVNYLSGEASISPSEAESFNLFGSSALLVGEYQVPPVFADFQELKSRLINSEHISDYTNIISSAAQVEVKKSKKAQILFGVNFEDYFNFFPGLEIIKGEIPLSGSPGIMIQEKVYNQICSENPDKKIFGSAALLTVAYDTSFTIREVPIVGVFRYPIEDQLLDRVAIVNADTARALNGYVYGASEEVDLSTEQNDLLSLDLGDMFGSEDSMDTMSEDNNDILGDIDSLFEDKEEIQTAQSSVSDAWTMILLKHENKQQERKFSRKLNNYDAELIYRDWRNTVGGNVLIVWFLRIILNAGIIFIIIGASAITINAIILSVYERTREIGTMRAIGAQRNTIAFMIGGEVIIIVTGAALLGIIGGLISTAIFNILSIETTNTFIISMFAGGRLQGRISFGLIFFHIISAVLLGFISLVSPLRKALLMEPVKAMNQ